MSSRANYRDYEYELLSSYCGSSRDDLPILGSLGLFSFDGVILGQLDLDFGLLDKLLANRIISGAELKILKSNNFMYNKHALLLNWITMKGKTSEFCDALERTHQTHLVNYAKSFGLYNAEFDLNWPLTQKQITQLDRNQEVLVELLEISPELADQLYSRRAITRRHNEYICSISSVALRTTEFLDILRRRSFWNYKQTIECLRTSQDYVTRQVADILEEGVVGQIELTLHEELSAENWSLLMGTLERTTEATIGLPPDAPAVNLVLVSAKVDNETMILYIFLRKVSETLLGHENERLRAIVEDYIHINLQPLKFYWHEDDYKRCRGYFEDVSTKTLYDIPKEIMETILSKAFALYFWLPPRPSDQDIFVSLSSICYFSFDILMKRRRFAKTVLPSIRAYYRIFKKRSAIIRINKPFLLENMKPRKSLIKRLCSVNCITESQVALINRLRFKNDRNQELLQLARKFSAKDHFAFVECLCSNGQHAVADVLEKGGDMFPNFAAVAVKVKMSNAKVAPRERTGKALVARLRQFLVECQKELRDFITSYKLQNTRLARIQIDKSSENDKDIAMWFWCRSRDDLHQVEQKHVELVKGISKLIKSFSEFPALDITPHSVRIDTSQFQKEMLNRYISVRRRQSFVKLNLHGTRPLAVAGLGDEIYVLYLKSIHIYQGQHPFAYQKEVPIPPLDQCCHTGNYITKSVQNISICRKSLCAYISCATLGCVRKLTARDHVHSFWLSGIEHMRCLCTMSTGDVVVMKARQDVENIVNSFEIYSSHADLLNQCQLQPSAEFPLHLVEMSPLKIAINYSRSWSITILSNDYQVISSRRVDSQYGYKSVTMFAEEKVIASILGTPNTPSYVTGVTILDSHLFLGSFVMDLIYVSYVCVFYCQERRQLITLRYLTSQLTKRADVTLEASGGPSIEVGLLKIKYNDEIDELNETIKYACRTWR